MNRILLIILTTVFTGTFMISCSDDDDDFGNVEVKNTKLRTILQNRGYTFNNEGNLVQDAQVQNTKSLDLSGCGLDDASGLGIFPNLTEVILSDNDFSNSFDFSVLPSSVTSVDLTDNEIYEYPGLVNVEKAENGDETVTVLREMKKLYLPASAKYNCNELVYFYEKKQSDIEAGTLDMKMEDANSSLAKYTTLREVPDNDAREQLKALFPSVFEEDKIDLTKRIVKPEEKNKMLKVDAANVEGVEYIMYNRSYEGTYYYITSTSDVASSIPCFKIDSTINKVYLSNIDTPNGIDLSEAKVLTLMTIYKNPSLETLDFSVSELMGQRDIKQEWSPFENGSYIDIQQCHKLTAVKFPEKINKVGFLTLIDLPLLQSIDLSKLESIGTLRLAKLPVCKITYLTPQYFTKGLEKSDDGFINFGIDKEIYDRAETLKFLDKYHENLSPTTIYFNGEWIDYNDWD